MTGQLHLRQFGFSLVELAIAVFVAGLLSVLMAPTFNLLATSNRLGYAEHQALINQEIADAMQQTAKVRNDKSAAGVPMRGRLPDPWTDASNPGGPLYSAVIDPNADCATYQSGFPVKALFACMLQRQGASFLEVNDDNYDTHRLRVFQKVTGLQTQVPLFFQGGPTVTLTYDYGAIYMTSCSQGDSTCLQPVSDPYLKDIPGISPQLTATTIGGAQPWNTVRACATATCPGPDYAPVFVSSLPAQMELMQQTTDRLDRVRDALKDYFKAMQVSSDASNVANWYPQVSPAKVNSPPVQGCMDGWYDLSVNGYTSILKQVGLDPVEYGQTAWGGPVEFCRHYVDPSNPPATNNTSPFFGAIRINPDLSSGAAPSNSSNNVVLTF
jgi:hypothetical protein